MQELGQDLKIVDHFCKCGEMVKAPKSMVSVECEKCIQKKMGINATLKRDDKGNLCWLLHPTRQLVSYNDEEGIENITKKIKELKKRMSQKRTLKLFHYDDENKIKDIESALSGMSQELNELKEHKKKIADKEKEGDKEKLQPKEKIKLKENEPVKKKDVVAKISKPKRTRKKKDDSEVLKRIVDILRGTPDIKAVGVENIYKEKHGVINQATMNIKLRALILQGVVERHKRINDKVKRGRRDYYVYRLK